MPDIVEPAVRSRMMSGIRGKNTKPEHTIRSMLHRRGFRFRLHVKTLPGKPDIVLPRYRAVVQVNGCFWHGHDCALFKWPSTRPEWWRDKIERNRLNDRRTTDALGVEGWRVVTVWECALKGRERLASEEVGTTLEQWLRDLNDRQLTIRGRRDETRDAG